MNEFNQQLGYINQGNSQRNNQQPAPYPYNNGIPYPYNNTMPAAYSGYGNKMNQPNQNTFDQFLKCRPVSSKEEARAAQIDLDGSLWVFTDIGNEKIYTKKINNDGTASFVTYARVEDENPYAVSGDFVTREEFNKVIHALMAAMQPTGPVSAQNNEENKSDASQPLINF